VDFFATAAKGTEPALRDELREIGLGRVRADRGGVHFSGELEDGWRACLWSRVAVRVLAWRGSFEARDAQALYDGVRALEWRHFLSPKLKLAVKASCRSSRLTHSQFVAQKTKDAIVDQIRDDVGQRPSVDLDDPDVLVVVHLAKDEAQVFVDLAGEALHRRGWREARGEAPLKENLAAAMLRLTGWDRKAPLVDPMCGAGTIAIEAAAWARNMAPGLSRKRFGFERWAYFDDAMRTRMAALRDEARAASRDRGPTVFASDESEAACEAAIANSARAGVEIVVTQRDVRALAPLGPIGFVATNPPYGERLATSDDLARGMARRMETMRGHDLGVLAGAPTIERAFTLAPRKWWLVYNGAIECHLLAYHVP
jgi:putative N6-adenine-specific DNA methylase